MSTSLPAGAEWFLLALATADTQAWVQAARAYATVRRTPEFTGARATLRRLARESRGELTRAASREIARRLSESTRAIQSLIGQQELLSAMERSALVAAHALALPDHLAGAELTLLIAPYREILGRTTPD